MSYLDLSQEVTKAKEQGLPIVALESTIIAHGMPYPQNMETAFRVEAIVREAGAIPATIAIINGRMKAGLEEKEIRFLAKEGPRIPKVSRRDIPWIMSRQHHGATTVASTMIIAARAGIRIFATGGIGGVHRGAAESMDISADLQELARTDVAVVTAGAKAILDLGLTLEYLETQGVPVIGFQTDEFPAFYTRKSGYSVPIRMDQVKEIAKMLKVKWELDLKGGVIIANPIPEKFQMDSPGNGKGHSTSNRRSRRSGDKRKRDHPVLIGSC